MSRIQHTPTVSAPTEPAVNEPVVQQPEAAPQAAPPAGAVEVRLTSAQLKERLDETRAAAERRLLSELGVDSLDRAKHALAQQSAAAEGNGKLKDLQESAAAQAARIAELESLVAAVTHERASSTLSSLPEQARRAIEEATDDPEERIALAQVLAAAGVSAPAPQPVAAPVQQVAGSTAPPRSAPLDASASTLDRKAEYQRLKQTNPVAAAHYLSRYSRDIFPG